MLCALIGWGYWGKIIERYIRNCEYLSLKYIYDPFLKADIALEDIFSDQEVECVFICTPINTHYDLVKKALTHNKHVFCEKPLCKNYNEVLELYEYSRKMNRCLHTDFIYTNSQSIKHMKKSISQIGNILFIKASIRQFGNFYEYDDVYEVLGVHMISAILFLLSDIGDINFTVDKNIIIKSDKMGKVLDGILQFNVNSKINGYVECSLLSNTKTRVIELIGENGILKFDMLGQNTLEIVLLNELNNSYAIEKEENFFYDEKNNLSNVLLDFYNSINEKNWYDNLELSRNVTRILNDIKY